MIPEASEGLVASITYRSIQPEDEPFLRSLYASTREDELSQVEWAENQKRAFLGMQFEAQHRYYQEQFSHATFLIIMVLDEPIGRLYIDRRREEIRLIEMSLVPEYRNRGIGTAMLGELLEEAARDGLPVHLHVDSFSPAHRLYRRHGFADV